jgi:hypothetical protein
VDSLEFEMNFCRLEVTVLHSLLNFTERFDRYRNAASIIKYFNTLTHPIVINFMDNDMLFQLQFDNTILSCELQIIDSTDDTADSFKFKVWNIPTDTILTIGDYLLFKFYYNSEPDVYTTYHCVVKSLKPSRDSEANLLTEITGTVVDQDILSNWSIYAKYPKLNTYNDVKDFVENELKFNFTTTVPGFVDKTLLTTPILTRGKSISNILTEVCSQASKSLGKDCGWKFVNSNTILIYKNIDLGTKLLNDQYNLLIPVINYNDIFEFVDNGTNFTVKVYGIPTLKSGVVFYVEVTTIPDYITAKSTYYVVEEIEHSITINDGYIMKIYCHVANTDTSYTISRNGETNPTSASDTTTELTIDDDNSTGNLESDSDILDQV